MRRVGWWVLIAVLISLVLPACSGRAGEASPTLTVFAAASALEVVEASARGFEGARVRSSFAGSSALARQIDDGAPADVVISASRHWIDWLQRRGRLEGPPQVLARNRLVVIAPPAAPAFVAAPTSARELIDALPADARIALADEGVPAGKYARQSLRKLGLWERWAPRVVGQDDVRSVLRAVQSGEAAAGVVYATDARLGGVQVLFTLDASSDEPVEVVGAVLRGSARPQLAARYLRWWSSPEGRAVLLRAGFEATAEAEAEAVVAVVADAPSAKASGLLSPEERDVVLLSLQVAGWVVLVSLIPGIGLAWILARWRSPLRTVLQCGVMLPLVLPPVVTGTVLLNLLGRSSALGRGWFALTGTHLSYSTAACVLAAAVVGLPLLVESVRLSIQGVDPRLEQVSRSLGRGRAATFLRVTLPLALPGVLAGSVLSFARALGEFGATIVLAGNIEGETRQIPLAVYTLMNTPDSEDAVLRLVAISVGLSLLALFAVAWLSRRGRGAPA